MLRVKQLYSSASLAFVEAKKAVQKLSGNPLLARQQFVKQARVPCICEPKDELQ